MATTTKRKPGETAGDAVGSGSGTAARRRKAVAPEETPAKARTRKVAAPEEALAKAKTRKAAAPEEAPAKARTRKAAAPEEAPAKARTRKAPVRKTGVVAGTGEVPAAPVPPESRTLEPPSAARFLPGTTGPLLPEENLGELPSSYGVDRLVMVPRDPGWMFLHWELSPAMLARTAGRRIVLQLRCRQAAGEGVTPPREVGRQGRFYAATGESCEAMQAVLGVVTDSGEVEELIRSGWVSVPAARPRPGTARFLTIPFDEPLRVGKRREGERLISLEGRVLTESQYLRLFGRAGPGSTAR
jgi:hypothetical protein